MGCIQAYFRKAQSGLSPSSTLDNEAPEVITEENVSGRISEKVSCSVVTEDDEPTEDDDPDKSQGVRATAVLSLAASTGTVAILGTTAQRIPSDVSETTLNTLQNLELEQDSFISNLDPATEKHIPLRDKDTVDASQEAVEEEKEPPNKLIEYTEEPKRIFSEKLIPNNTIAESTLSSTTVSLADEERGVPEVTVTLTSESSVDVESDGGITSEAHDESSTATEVLHLLADDGQAGEETSEHDTTTTKSESSPLVVQAIELEERSSTADSDVTMQKEAISDAHRTDRDVSDTSISIDETSGDVTKATHTAGLTNDYNLIENEDSSESFETYSLGLGTKLQFEEQKIPKPEDQKKLVQIEAINQKLVREASDDEMPTTVLELTKDIVRADEALDKLLIDSPKTLVSCEFTKDRIVNGGVDVWREDNNSNIISKVNSTDKDVVNSILESNEYVERVKLKAEDLVNEICAQAETVNQNGGLEIKPETAAEQPQFIVSSVILSKANSVDAATRAGRPVSLSETKLRTSMTSSFEDALLNVNFGESATSDYSKEGVAGFCPRLSTIGSELELAPSFAERSSPDPESDFSDTDEESPDLPTGEELRKQLPESAVETIREEIDDICERAVERATQLANEKLAKKDDDSDSNEISENGTSTNNPSISLSEDTQILESNNTGVLSDDAALTSAATTIQANFRGYQVRKAHKSKQDMPATESTIVEDDDLPPPDMDLLGSEGDTISEEDLPQPPEFDDLPLPEDLAELDDYVVTPEIRDQMQRRNTIIEQQRLLAAQSGASMASMAESASSTEVESSLSSAATKIQAGIRGYLTRKHLKNASSTTAPSMDDSDLSASGDVAGQDQIKKALSVEDTEIQRHPFSPPDDRYMAGKRMSLDSRLKSASDASKVRPPMRSVMSECVDDSSASAMEGGGRRSQGLRKSSSPGSIGLGRIGTGEVGGGGGTKGTGGGGGPGSADEEERAAACIQSSYRDYKSRQRLKRGDAMQMPTTSSSVTPVSVTPVSAVSAANSEDLRDAPKHTGEYHDIIALSPPLLQRVLEEEPDAEDDSEKAEPPKTGTGNGGSGAKKAEESELIDAAIKIQSVYRGYKTRKDLDAGDSRTETESLASTPTEREPIKTVTSEGLPVPASQQQGAVGAGSATDDANAEDLNATKIQAAVRGFLTRKQLEEQKEAAVKIQGNFRKYNARKKGKSKK